MTTPSGSSAVPDSAVTAFQEFSSQNNLQCVEAATYLGFCVADGKIGLVSSRLDTRISQLLTLQNTLITNHANSQNWIASLSTQLTASQATIAGLTAQLTTTTTRAAGLERDNNALRQEMAAMRLMMNQLADRLGVVEHGVVHRNDDAISVASALPSLIGGGSDVHDSDIELELELDERFDLALGNPQA